jgi:hypothetical protein
VVELVDTPALGAGGRKPLGVQVPPPASAVCGTAHGLVPVRAPLLCVAAHGAAGSEPPVKAGSRPSRHGERELLGEQRGGAGSVERAAEQEALPEVAAELDEQGALVGALDALADCG